MEGERKYKQRGYMDVEQDMRGGSPREQRPQGPRPPIDITGPRLPRMVQTVTASRCYNCSTTLPNGTDFRGLCPKCSAPLHCCKQCIHFEPSTRFQCLKPIPARIPAKDQANECDLFEARVTVARDTTAGSGPAAMVNAPRNSEDARAAFDNLFKK